MVHFRIREHIIPCSHIREYPRATSQSEEETLHVAVKHYVPLNNSTPKPGDVTIIGAHANGFPKELYEPLWEDLLQESEKHGFSIRGIWIADASNQGQSGVLNEQKLGDDPCWFDLSRDLLHMINHFRIPTPIIGVGHSFGGCVLANLALMHPRLMTSLVLIDPVILRRLTYSGAYLPAAASAQRRDRWPSRADAEQAMKRSRFYQVWNRRVFDRWIEHGLRNSPCSVCATAGAVVVPHACQSKEVMLTTSKDQEVLTFLRPDFRAVPKMIRTGEVSASRGELGDGAHPDIAPQSYLQTQLHRAEPLSVFHQLPHLRPTVLYIFGSRSNLTDPDIIADKVANTGVGSGGSGGEKAGRVSKVVLEDAGHLIPMERVAETAEHTARWIGSELRGWTLNEQLIQEDWEGRTGFQRSAPTDRFLAELSRFHPFQARTRKL